MAYTDKILFAATEYQHLLLGHVNNYKSAPTLKLTLFLTRCANAEFIALSN